MISIEKIIIDRKSNIEWFYEEEYDQYRVVVKLYNRDIYTKVLDRKHYDIYHNYINERVKYILDGDILNKEYDMILIDDTMYKVIDKTRHHKEFLRALIPIGAINFHDLENQLFDLVLDCTLRTGEVFDETDLVYHNGVFYNQGIIITNVKEFEYDGIEYENYDLLNGLTEEQVEYIFYKSYSLLDYIKIQNYVTSNVRIKIDR